MNSLTKWLRVTNQFSSEDDDVKPTHLMLNGYKLYIKNENAEIFYKKYCESLQENADLYVVECKREIFKLFFDLDFLLSSEKYEEIMKTDIENNVFTEIIRIINDVIYDFYNRYYDCIVTTADIKLVKKLYKNEENPENVSYIEFVKKGFHLHFPDININKNYALEIRKTCINKLLKYKEYFENSINDIVDEHVFTSSGLRMTGSKKGHYVSQTREFVCEGRPYNLLFTLKDNQINYEYKNELNDNLLMLIIKTSIVTKDEYITNIINNPNLECEDCEEDSNKFKENLDEEERQGTWNRLSRNDLRHIEILRFFNCNVSNYNIKDIKRIYYSDNESVYILCSQSKYCSNIGKNHNSEHIYFKLNREGICQKCFCKCDTMDGRKYGFCKDYSSTIIPCTPHLRKMLNFKEIKIDKTKIIKNNKVNSEDINVNTLFDNLRDTWYNQFTNKDQLPTKRKPKSSSTNTK
jgi:hypothetical protein